MTDNNKSSKTPNAWIAIDHNFSRAQVLTYYTLQLKGEHSLHQAISDNDWILVLDTTGNITRVGRILRIRSDLETTTIFFDRMLQVKPVVSIGITPFKFPPKDRAGRIQWTDFIETLPKEFHITIADIPKIEDQTYIRELLQLAVMDDLLGPAGGPNELIVDMGVRDRYLVGKLAPREAAERGQEFPVDAEDIEDEEPDLIVKAKTAKVNSPSVLGSGETDTAEEIDAASNQSLVPSSLGMTFCVDGDVDRVEIEARWGRYERVPNDEHQFFKSNGQKAKVWKRIPCGGKIVLPLIEGSISHNAPDSTSPEVRVQGSIRAKNDNGDRLITLFLVNAQEEPDTNRDTAWVFQPELIVRAEKDAAKPAIFRRRPVLDADGMDPEREALEMIYRDRVEFAVGHGVAVHAEIADDVTLATEVRTTVMPQYEVQATETPGLELSDRPAMREMVSSGLLDMQRLATLDIDPLVDALSVLTNDYATWIDEQNLNVSSKAKGFKTQAQAALDRCQEIHTRLQQGINTLKHNENALAAFRFANQAMATQRIRSLYALAMRRGEDVTLDKFDALKNRSWRPFQLAFLLLSIPSLADPCHPDRVKPIEAYADLLWFPTGGGKTEAYLGVAAFTMAIRRMQGNLGGYDSSRGLTVIMRYTLRLLTLQQFQRATALICAMEVLRREALNKGDKSLGTEPFTIGLWVGNKVTPGTTEDSHNAIEKTRNPGSYNAGTASPVQLTSCPWCGTEIIPGQDVEVKKDKAGGRTFIYCGDKKGRCEFSKGKSSKQLHPGIPVLVVDEEIYHRPPTMMIATVDKFAMMAWRGQVRTLFGRVEKECERHGLLWPGANCTGNHQAFKGQPSAKVKAIPPIRPPDLIIQDEFHLISGPLGTMVGLYETAVDELCSWTLNGKTVKPKIIASTATVRKAKEQVNNVFMRQVSVFPPHGLNVEDNFFSVQRHIKDKFGRRYLGVCSPGSSRPAMLIRVYTAFLTAAQELFDHFGEPADPYMTMVGYFNSLRELGGMKRLAEDDVQTRSYRVQMSMVERPALAQRSVNNIRELTSRVSSQDIPKYLDNLEVKFKAEFDNSAGKYVTKWQEGDTRAIDVVLATNMLSVGVDVNRLGLMAVNGQPKGTAEYIQATSRVGRSFPGLVCTVLTWARPRDLSHYETFEHYHATFYKHVEAQSVTPFSPRAMDRGLTGSLLSLMRLKNNEFSPNEGAGKLDMSNQSELAHAIEVLATRAGNVAEDNTRKLLAENELKERADEWAKEASKGGRILGYEKRGPDKDKTVALIKSPGLQAWDNWTVPMSMREVESGVRLIMDTKFIKDDHDWKPRPATKDED
ncbi:DISARM system helicase DrmA [Citrobacter freundii complex sp. 2023EL-00966]|uniref:DISARM system helicase DrmA n=1 Tax=Citrobacter freundii complex sp. 2023EL-00966 TaxID=3076118 RepID=UPI0028952F77|nr:DISARM system helicase DrmA [Citrobacter freundii complex sp. 2023EL-00966]MDT3754059.1 DISARM system helicase DrmA [Citrobacter freundii complex sp. 2023EL-00966]